MWPAFLRKVILSGWGPSDVGWCLIGFAGRLGHTLHLEWPGSRGRGAGSTCASIVRMAHGSNETAGDLPGRISDSLQLLRATGHCAVSPLQHCLWTLQSRWTRRHRCCGQARQQLAKVRALTTRIGLNSSFEILLSSLSSREVPAILSFFSRL